MKKITLCMIVKNEAHILPRCFASALPIIDASIVVDTGSTDGTVAFLHLIEYLTDGRYKCSESAWKDFSTNRNELLAIAKYHDNADTYLLLLDADEVLQISPEFLAWLHDDNQCDPVYNVATNLSGVSFSRPALVRAGTACHYEGKIHEYLVVESGHGRIVDVPGLIKYPMQDSARAKDPDRYFKDVVLLEQELERDPCNTRTLFYLAQSYRDTDQIQRAFDMYAKRAAIREGYSQEIFYSKWMMATMGARLGLKDEEQIALWENAIKEDLLRAEPLYGYAHFWRDRGCHYQALKYARTAAALKIPEGALFVSERVYTHHVKELVIELEAKLYEENAYIVKEVSL